MSAYTDGTGLPSHEVLVITDLAPASMNALWRAALIAREQGASLRLLHVGGERRRMTQTKRRARQPVGHSNVRRPSFSCSLLALRA